MAGYGGFYPYFMNLNTSSPGSNYSWLTGAFANPGYRTNLVWATVTWKFEPPPQVYVAAQLAEPPKAAFRRRRRQRQLRRRRTAAGHEDHARFEALFDFDKAVLAACTTCSRRGRT